MFKRCLVEVKSSLKETLLTLLPFQVVWVTYIWVAYIFKNMFNRECTLAFPWSFAFSVKPSRGPCGPLAENFNKLLAGGRSMAATIHEVNTISRVYTDKRTVASIFRSRTVFVLKMWP